MTTRKARPKQERVTRDLDCEFETDTIEHEDAAHDAGRKVSSLKQLLPAMRLSKGRPPSSSEH